MTSLCLGRLLQRRRRPKAPRQDAPTLSGLLQGAGDFEDGAPLLRRPERLQLVVDAVLVPEEVVEGAARPVVDLDEGGAHVREEGDLAVRGAGRVGGDGRRVLRLTQRQGAGAGGYEVRPRAGRV